MVSDEFTFMINLTRFLVAFVIPIVAGAILIVPLPGKICHIIALDRILILRITMILRPISVHSVFDVEGSEFPRVPTDIN